MQIRQTKEITARGVRNHANRLDVLMLAYSDILRFMDETIDDMVSDKQDTRGLYATTRELHTLRDFLMSEVEGLEEFADTLEKK